jgi:hypothetical protein
MAFIENPANDPVLRKAERIARLGSMLPALGWALLNLLGGFLSLASRLALSRSQYVEIVAALGVLGQIIVWIGMSRLRLCRGWASGIDAYLWSGGMLTFLVVGGTLLAAGLPAACPAALIPWGAPLAATVAGRRARRGGG